LIVIASLQGFLGRFAVLEEKAGKEEVRYDDSGKRADISEEEAFHVWEKINEN